MPSKKKGKGKGRGQDTRETEAVQPQTSAQEAQPRPIGGRGRGQDTREGLGAQAFPPRPIGRGRSSPPSPSDFPQLGITVPPSAARPTFETPPRRPAGRGRSNPPSPSEVPQLGTVKPSSAVRPAYEAPTKPPTGKVGESFEKTSVVESSAAKELGTETLEQIAGLTLKQKPRETPRKQFSVIPRPGLGTLGRKITLVANYFMLNFKDVCVYHYDIDILEVGKDKKAGQSLLSEGKTVKEDLERKVGHVEHQQKRNIGKAKCREIISNLIKIKKLEKFHPVYDGQKNIFTSQPLPIKGKTQSFVEYELEGKLKIYGVVIKPVQKEDGSNVISLEPLKELYSKRSKEIPYEVLLVYDTVMNHRDPPLTQVQLRSSFFSLDQAGQMPLGGGLEIWFGYNQSVRLAERGPVVIINLAAKVFHQAGSVIHYVSDILKCDLTKIPRMENWQISEVEKNLKTVRVQVTHQKHPRRYKVRGVTKLSAKELTFETENKRQISVAQYFWDKYQVRLKYPNLPCLHMQTNNPNTYIPMELCQVVEGQAKLGKLSGEITSKMIRSTAIPPLKRFESIAKDAKKINDVGKQNMNAFGLFMDVTLMKVNGRVLTAPVLSYAGDHPSSQVKPNEKGVWRIEDAHKFYRVKRIDKWVLISFASDKFCGMDKLKRFCEMLVSSCRKHGMSFGPPADVKIFDRRTKTEQAVLYAKEKGAEFAIFVLSKRDNFHFYEEVKFFSDFRYNLVTQCMDETTLNRINPQITTNVSLKINVKLGGINHIIVQRPQVFRRPVIVFGADAIHWARGYGYPSIASVVGSLDPTASRYALTCSLQDQREVRRSQEIIVKLKDIVKGILNIFESVNMGRKPEKIIFYRDGISEGQFEAALEEEVSSIQTACKELYNGVVLPITYIVVQKKHQTRFRPNDPREGVGNCGNVPPGTTVDTGVTHPVFFDFFICSHEGIQGTSKPAHYNVLHDDNRLTADELQQLSYFLCHTYVRCTRSVSLPAPILYADLAASRAKRYADLFVNSDSSSSSDCVSRPLPAHVTEAIESMKSFENNMFYV
ncbi:protein argonaute-2-like [Uloborus diversus]|uniref:protein argonaute-2-like n=1 Tax=Uloborus diversus TaxID=327109 RepID=UPI0024093DD3|nr:protein argonaute-2-like [Uloborus diversus]